MAKKKYYLITTSDENTWKFDCPIIFLGEWCCRYSRKNIWQNLNYIVAKPYGLEKSRKDIDYSETLKIEENLFPELCNLLNSQHNKNYSARFWKIVLGHWFKFTIRDLFREINTLKQCFNEHNIYGTSTYAYDEYSLTPYNISEAIAYYDYESWKINVKYAKIINFLKKENFTNNVLYREKFDNSLGLKKKVRIKKNQSIKKKFFSFIYKAYAKVARKFIKDDDAYIINSYLSFKDEIKLELLLGQFPQLWKYQDDDFVNADLLKIKPDHYLRDNLTRKFAKKTDDQIENIIRNLTFELLPIVYLEGFLDIIKLSSEQTRTKSPKFIFTSNNFYLDEYFKNWSALQVENGYKLFIGQHGNNYGTLRYKYPRIEELTADKFITWGWSGSLPQYVPGFILKTSGQKKIKNNLNGGLLLIQNGYTKTDTTFDSKFEYLKYLDAQKEFVNCLTKNLREKLTIRLFNENYQNEEWEERLRWRDFDPKLKIDNGQVNINKLIIKNKLTVHSYDSTGMLELLSQNLPTLAFWQNELDHLLDDAKPYYKLLVDAGIVHFSPKSTADKIKEVWDDIDNWWSQNSVQNARKLFCERYAKVSKNPASDLKQILLS